MLQVRKILYPTDFSKCSRQALTHALFLAEQLDAELHFLHAVVLHDYDPNDETHSFPDPEAILEKMFENAGSEMARLLEEHAARPLAIRESTRRGFRAAEVILDYAAEQEIDLVVMGTHGRRRAARMLLGSVAEEVVRLADCPVLTLREQREPRVVEEVDKIVVPVDFSPASTQVVSAAKQLASVYDGHLELVHVIEETPYPYFYAPFAGFDFSEKMTELQEKSGEMLNQLADEAEGPEVEYNVYVLTGRPASRIAEFAEERRADMVVIATHGLSGLGRLLVGSTAEQVVRSVPCPVLTMKPSAAAA